MSPKNPVKGVVTVDVHTRPSESTLGSVQRPTDPSSVPVARLPHVSNRTAEAAELEAIRPAPSVTVSQISSTEQTLSRTAQPPLKHYWISEEVQLPAADSEGVRVYKGRRYVEVPEGGTVLVAADTSNGLYRARLATELQPTGPFLARDPDSNIWRPLADPTPVTYPLKASRLAAFRTGPDFSDVTPGPDHLHRYLGKLYVTIENHTYQVLHDQDYSSPHTAVMRIVQPQDAVAGDDQNLYVATRPGRSEPIVHDSATGWVGTLVGGVSGMPKAKKNTIAQSAIANVVARLDADTLAINAGVLKAREMEAQWQQARGDKRERETVVKFEVQLRRLIPLLENSRDFYVTQRETLALVKDTTVYKKELLERQIALIGAYTRLMLAKDARNLHELRDATDILQTYRSAAIFLTQKLATAEKRQQVAAEVLKSSPSSQSELDESGFDSGEIHSVRARWIDARSRLLSDVPTDADFIPSRLATAFAEMTLTFEAIDSMPAEARIAVLSMMLDQCAAIRASYQRFDLGPDPAHASARDEIIQAIRTFEATLEERLDRYHQNLQRASALPVHEQPIDFDFIPVQNRAGPAQNRRRVFRARHHGAYKICIGQPRRTPAGDEVIDVMSTDHQSQPLRTYERHEGEWQRVVPTPDTPLDTLMAEATRSLERTESHLNVAWQEERGRETASNILHNLERRAEELDDLCAQIARTPNPLTIDIDPLQQQLKRDSQRLRDEGEGIRVRLYKDKAYLSADRVAYLINHGHLSARQTHTRVPRGKGGGKHFLDIYVLQDRQTQEALWHAHFKYDQPDTPAANFKLKGGHLKTLAQSGSGASAQRRDEQAGRPHVAIWRHTLDDRTAKQIFDLAH